MERIQNTILQKMTLLGDGDDLTHTYTLYLKDNKGGEAYLVQAF